jgi:uncharacterized protein YcfJ
MRRRITVMVAIVMLTIAGVAKDADAWQRDDWGNVERLKAGTAVRISLKSGGWIDGNFTGADDALLQVNLLDGSGAGNAPRDDVKSVTLLYAIPPPGPDIHKWLLVGAATGAVAGAAIGGSRDVTHGSNYHWAEGALAGGLFGMMGSAAVQIGVTVVRGARFRTKKVVYAAR